MKLNSLLLAVLGITSFSVSGVHANDVPVSELLVPTDYQLVSKKRISRTEFEYEYSFSVLNNTENVLEGVFATVISNSDKAVVTDSTANLGIIPSFGNKITEDTIKVRVDRRGRFSPYDVFEVRFDSSALEGLDANNNEIRDDFEVFLKEFSAKFPDNGEAFQNLARLSTKRFLTSSKNDYRQLILEMIHIEVCDIGTRNPAFEFTKALTFEALNSRERDQYITNMDSSSFGYTLNVSEVEKCQD